MDTQEHPMNAADVLAAMLFALEQGISPAELLDENSPLMDEARRVLKPVDPATQTDYHDKSDADPRVELLALKIRALEAEGELKRRNQSASDRLHNICRAIEKEADGSAFSREEWNRLDAENSTLHAEIRELKKGTT